MLLAWDSSYRSWKWWHAQCIMKRQLQCPWHLSCTCYSQRGVLIQNGQFCQQMSLQMVTYYTIKLGLSDLALEVMEFILLEFIVPSKVMFPPRIRCQMATWFKFFGKVLLQSNYFCLRAMILSSNSFTNSSSLKHSLRDFTSCRYLERLANLLG